MRADREGLKEMKLSEYIRKRDAGEMESRVFIIKIRGRSVVCGLARGIGSKGIIIPYRYIDGESTDNNYLRSEDVISVEGNEDMNIEPLFDIEQWRKGVKTLKEFWEERIEENSQMGGKYAAGVCKGIDDVMHLLEAVMEWDGKKGTKRKGFQTELKKGEE